MATRSKSPSRAKSKTRPPTIARSQPHTGMLDRSIAGPDGLPMPYQVYVPRSYASRRDWPVLLFLHGAGERGNDGLLQTEVGLGPALRRFSSRYPALVVMPQAPEQNRWAGAAAETALQALDATLAEFTCDANRVFLTGLSMGGEGAWYLAWQHRARFAALLNVCGWVAGRFGRPSFVPPPAKPSAADVYDQLAAKLRGLPIWLVHGEADRLVPVQESRRMAEALEAVGSPVTYTELPGVDHNAWDAAYQSETIAQWLFAQRRSGSS